MFALFAFLFLIFILGRVIERSQVPLPAIVLSCNATGQVIHTCVNVTKQYNFVLTRRQ